MATLSSTPYSIDSTRVLILLMDQNSLLEDCSFIFRTELKQSSLFHTATSIKPSMTTFGGCLAVRKFLSLVYRRKRCHLHFWYGLVCGLLMVQYIAKISHVTYLIMCDQPPLRVWSEDKTQCIHVHCTKN